MCGQFSLDLDAFALKDEFDISEMPSVWEIRPHIFPAQPVAVIKSPDVHSVNMMNWGLIPFWAKDETFGRRTFNARSETLREKPSFRMPFQKQRCLIPATGFYEWKRKGGTQSKATPYQFQLAGNKVFAFAGLWDVWQKPEHPVFSCTIITCDANAFIQPYHDRMPVILQKEDYNTWLNSNTLDELQKLLVPFPPELMTVTEYGEGYQELK